jgi:hypothetical protein
VYGGKVWWDGKYDSFPEPISKEFSGPPAPEAIGKYAYVTMMTGYGGDFDQYMCLGLSLITSIQQTNPDPNIDIVVVLLVDDGDVRYLKLREGDPEFAKITPIELIGDMFYDALISAGVTRFLIWRELPTEGKDMAGPWKQAFTKLRVWSLIDYEKVLFMDADTLAFRNLDHLFQEEEFTSGATWGCLNSNAPLQPSGGLWVIQPSLNVWGLIQAYIKGRDPCAHQWRLGDMIMTWILFIDVSALVYNAPEDRQQFDGDWTRFGRCQELGMYPSRFDLLPTGDFAPHNRWNMLNESYDILVDVCSIAAFYFNPNDDRYRVLRGMGNTTFDRPDAFTVHFSCGHKPRCHRFDEEYYSLGLCAQSMFDRWMGILNTYYRPRPLTH